MQSLSSNACRDGALPEWPYCGEDWRSLLNGMVDEFATAQHGRHAFSRSGAKLRTRNLESNMQAQATWVACRSCREGTIAPGCLVRSSDRQAGGRLVARAAGA